MFKKNLIFLLVILSCISMFSCGYSAQGSPTTTQDNPYEELLDALEAKLAELQGSYADLNDDAKAELEALKAEIERLKGVSSAVATTQAATTQAVTTAPPQIYRYKINEGKMHYEKNQPQIVDSDHSCDGNYYVLFYGINFC